jgi:hypothetical protein
MTQLTARGQFVRDEPAAPGVDLWLNSWGTAFDDVMDHPSAHGLVNTRDCHNLRPEDPCRVSRSSDGGT